MAFDFRAIQRLPPDERVEALRRLGDELRKLIEKRNKEIKDSRREIEEAEELLERAEEEMVVLQKIAMPENKGVKIDDLFFKKEEKKNKALEEEVEEAPVPVRRRMEEEQQQQQYQPRQEQSPVRFYEQKPFEPEHPPLREYVSPNQPLPDTRTAYVNRKEEKKKLVSEGVYEKD
jgi:hypothetical protein